MQEVGEQQQAPATNIAAEAAMVVGPSAAETEADEETVTFKIAYGKHSSDVTRRLGSSVGELKAEIERTLSIPPSHQKLMFKGMLKDDAATLRQAGIKNGVKVLLIGSSPAEVAVAKPSAVAVEGKDGAWDAPASDEPLCKQPQHAKILAKGKPEDALPGVRGKQVPMSDALVMIPGLLNSQGSKVRLTFKTDLGQLWIGSAQATQKVPYSSISKIESFPIEGQEEYSILALHLGSGSSSRYLLYFYPSQYVAGIKIRILGVDSLL